MRGCIPVSAPGGLAAAMFSKSEDGDGVLEVDRHTPPLSPLARQVWPTVADRRHTSSPLRGASYFGALTDEGSRG